MSNFLKAKKYYTKKEMDEYVTKLMSTTEVTLMEQRERILALKQQNEKLAKELSERKKVDKVEKKTLESVQGKCDMLQEETKSKCAETLAFVKEFAVNWHKQFVELVEKYGIKETSLLDRFIVELGAISSQYGEQTEDDKRFSDLLARVKQKRKEQAKIQLAEENFLQDDEFSIDEALNPVDPLEDILKDLINGNKE